MRSQVRRGSCSCSCSCSCSYSCSALPCSGPARPPSRPSAALLLCCGTGHDTSWTAMTMAIMFQTGGHAQCLWTARGGMGISLLCMGNRPNTMPTAASPVCLGFQAATMVTSLAGPARQERGLRRPPPLPLAM